MKRLLKLDFGFIQSDTKTVILYYIATFRENEIAALRHIYWLVGILNTPIERIKLHKKRDKSIDILGTPGIFI